MKHRVIKWIQAITSKSNELIVGAFDSQCKTFKIVPYRKGWSMLFDNRSGLYSEPSWCGTVKQCKLAAEKILEEEIKQ